MRIAKATAWRRIDPYLMGAHPPIKQSSQKTQCLSVRKFNLERSNVGCNKFVLQLHLPSGFLLPQPHIRSTQPRRAPTMCCLKFANPISVKILTIWNITQIRSVDCLYMPLIWTGVPTVCHSCMNKFFDHSYCYILQSKMWSRTFTDISLTLLH